MTRQLATRQERPTNIHQPGWTMGSRSCRDTALEAWAALGLRDVTRVDMIVDGAGEPWVLEVNVSPGMTETSLLPRGAVALGMGLAELCDAVTQPALSRESRS